MRVPVGKGTAPAPSEVFGAVLAGGESRRFGRDKALYPLGGRPMAQWAVRALSPWTSFQGLMVNDARISRALDLPGRPDLLPGKGPLAGLHAACRWAEEEGCSTVFLLACDLPLVSSDLVGRILGEWPAGSLAVVPESEGPLGVEPLCAAYSCRCLPLLEELLGSGQPSMMEALSRMQAHTVPPASLGTREELNLAFTNVNDPAGAEDAEELLRAMGSSVSVAGGKDEETR